MASIRLSAAYPVSRDAVWKHLTDDALLGLWCMSSEGFALEKGRKFELRGEPSRFWDGVFHNTVIYYDPQAFLSYRCESRVPALDTVVTWKLVGTKDYTELSLEHSGFRPVKDMFVRQALASGWKRMLDCGLCGVLESVD